MSGEELIEAGVRAASMVLLDATLLPLLADVPEDCFDYPPARQAIHALREAAEIGDPCDWGDVLKFMPRGSWSSLEELMSAGAWIETKERRLNVLLAAARLLREHHALRQIATAGQEIAAGNGSAAERLAEARVRLEKIRLPGAGPTGTVGDAVRDVVARIEAKITEKPISTGLFQLDGLMGGGLYPGLTLLGAKSSSGKTSLACQIAANAAADGHRALVFSLEMSRLCIGRLFLAQVGAPSALRQRQGDLSADEIEALGIGAGRICAANIALDCETTALSEIEAAATEWLRSGPPGLIVLDYLQLIQTAGEYESRNVEVAAISAALKRISKNLDAPLLILSQLNRGADRGSKADDRPRLSSLRDSGSLEQDADQVLLLWRRQDRTMLLLEKARQGPTGEVELCFEAPRQRFVEARP